MSDPSDQLASLIGIVKHARDTLHSCPVGEPRRLDLYVDLAVALWILHRKTGSVESRDEMFKISHELGALYYEDPTARERAVCCTLLAHLLTHRAAQTNELALYEQAAELSCEALDLCPVGHPNRAMACAGLAVSLKTRYSRIGDVALLDESIQLEREALDLCPAGHPDRATIYRSLVVSLMTRYSQTGDVALLDGAIQMQREALGLHPRDHPNQATLCAHLAMSLKIRCGQTGDTTLIDEAIELEQTAFDLRPPGHPNRAATCANLAMSLKIRYNQTQTGDVALLDEAIELEREVLGLCLAGHPDRAASCANLAVSLAARYSETGDMALLYEAIELEREALELRPVDHPDRATSCANLAVSLKKQYEQTGDLILLDELIQLERETLDLRPIDHPDRVASCANLAVSLTIRYNHTGDTTLLDEAIELQRKALGLHPSEHPNQVTLCANLAVSLKIRYDQTGNVALLDEAIELERKAFNLRPTGHPNRAASCANMAVSLKIRYDQTGNVALLDEAIELERKAFNLRPTGHPNRAASCANMAVSLKIRHNQTGDVAWLDEAIELEREALDLCPTGHPDRAASCANLAMSLMTRYDQTGDVALLDAAVELEREAFDLRPTDHPDRATSCASLATSLSKRYDHTGDVALLDEAIELDREALKLRFIGHPHRATSCTNLALSLTIRYDQTGDTTLIDETIQLEREALDLCPTGHPDRARSCVNLATSLTTYYRQTRDVTLLDESFHLCNDAALQCCVLDHAWRSLSTLASLHIFPNTQHSSILKAVECLQQCTERPVQNLQAYITDTCHVLRSLWHYQDAWSSEIIRVLFDLYTDLIDRLPLMAGFVLDTRTRLRSLKSSNNLGPDACVLSLRAQQSIQALELLDHAHGVVWAQALHQRDPELAGAPPELARELDQLLRAIAMPVTEDVLSSLGPQLTGQDIRHQQNIRIQVILQEIRGMPGLERFMLGNTYDMLREAARNHPIVVLVAARSTVVALIMANAIQEQPDVLYLDLKWSNLQSLKSPSGQANLRHSDIASEPTEGITRQHEFPRLSEGGRGTMRPGDHPSSQGPLPQLWTTVVKPVLTRLGINKAVGASRRPRLHWCTTGELASLPIHAAGIHHGDNQECCSDYVISSYTPTLTSLLRAQRDLKPIATADAKILLVAADSEAYARILPLPGVQLEVSGIRDIADEVNVRSACTANQATAALPSATMVHIACHGSQDVDEPLKSAFHLSDDDTLPVSDLMKLNLKGVYLAFLSACETAKGDRDQPDQAIHLAATMLFVGFKSVVATMWAMRDEDGPFIAEAFYKKLFEGETISADSIAYALDHAVRMLKERLARGSDSLERWATFIHVGA